MTYIIDRRLNPRGKSLGNRQRFIRRARAQIKDAVQKSLKDRTVSDFESGQEVSISTKSTEEPQFRHAKTGGTRDYVHTGNKEFVEGDEIKKPRGGGGGGKQASDHGEEEDSFEFTLTQEEILDLFFEDLELPNLVKTSLTEAKKIKYRRAGFSTSGSSNNINLVRTMRNSFGRRIALGRPSVRRVAELKEKLLTIQAKDELSDDDIDRKLEILDLLEEVEGKRKRIPYIDPLDVRYHAYAPMPVPTSQAVMFCLMDVSGSMGEHEKDLAKRFYILLHLFLKRRYKTVNIVFIRHTHEAQEVDEHTFFYSRQSGGTIVSTALDEMIKVAKDRYATDAWNIYVAQASDGYTQSGDAQYCVELLTNIIMPMCQYYAYIEILDEREMEVFADEESGAELWRAYRQVHHSWPNFAMTRISKPSDIYPVFRELFVKRSLKDTKSAAVPIS